MKFYDDLRKLFESNQDRLLRLKTERRIAEREMNNSISAIESKASAMRQSGAEAYVEAKEQLRSGKKEVAKITLQMVQICEMWSQKLEKRVEYFKLLAIQMEMADLSSSFAKAVGKLKTLQDKDINADQIINILDGVEMDLDDPLGQYIDDEQRKLYRTQKSNASEDAVSIDALLSGLEEELAQEIASSSKNGTSGKISETIK